jgi:hypothetical protein
VAGGLEEEEDKISFYWFQLNFQRSYNRKHVLLGRSITSAVKLELENFRHDERLIIFSGNLISMLIVSAAVSCFS